MSTIEPLIKEGLQLSESGDFDAALERFHEVRQLQPEDPRCYLYAGSTYLKTRQYPEAKTCFEEAFDRFGTANFLLHLARTHTLLCDAEAALARYRLMIETFPDDPRGYAQCGNNLIDAKRYEEAKQVFQEGLKRCGSADFAERLGHIMTLQGDDKGALTWFDELCARAANDERGWLLSGQLLKRLGRLDAALDRFRTGRSKAQSVALAEAMAEILLQRGETEAAAASLDAIVKDERLLAQASLISAEALLAGERAEDAIAALIFALANTNETIDTFRRAGRIFLAAARDLGETRMSEIVHRCCRSAHLRRPPEKHRRFAVPFSDGEASPGRAMELLDRFSNPRIRYDAFGMMAVCFPRPGAREAFKKRGSIPSLEIVDSYIDASLFAETVDCEGLFGFVHAHRGVPVVVLLLMMYAGYNAAIRATCQGMAKVLWLEITWQSRWLADRIAEGSRACATIHLFSRYPLVSAASEGEISFLPVWFGGRVPGEADVVFSTDDLDNDLMEKTSTHRILVPHGQLWHIYSYDWSTAEQSAETKCKIIATCLLRFQDRCDYVFVPQPQDYLAEFAKQPKPAVEKFIDQVRMTVKLPAGLKEPIASGAEEPVAATRLTVVSAGHPRLDRVIAQCKERPTAERLALIAPRALFTQKPEYRSWYVSAFTHIVERLLEEHPQYEVVFREIPGSLGYETLRDGYAANSRFEYSTVPDYVDQYAQSAFLITDGSSVLYSYSLSRLRPVVVVDPNASGLRRTIYGAEIGDSGLIDEAIADCLERRDEIHQSLIAFRQSNLGHVGQSVDRILDLTGTLLDGGSPEGLDIRFKPKSAVG